MLLYKKKWFNNEPDKVDVAWLYILMPKGFKIGIYLIGLLNL